MQGCQREGLEEQEEGWVERGESAKGRCLLTMKKSFDLFMFIQLS